MGLTGSLQQQTMQLVWKCSYFRRSSRVTRSLRLLEFRHAAHTHSARPFVHHGGQYISAFSSSSSNAASS